MLDDTDGTVKATYWMGARRYRRGSQTYLQPDFYQGWQTVACPPTR